MSWTPKVGDRVTVAGDDRVRVVRDVEVNDLDSTDVRCDVTLEGDEHALWWSVPPSMLTPVPKPTPEPPNFVNYRGRTYRRYLQNVYGTFIPVLIDPADDDQVRDAGLCRVDEVAYWLFTKIEHAGWEASTVAFRERFGGGSDE